MPDTHCSARVFTVLVADVGTEQSAAVFMRLLVLSLEEWTIVPQILLEENKKESITQRINSP